MKHRFCASALAAVLLLSAAPLSPAASAAFSDAEGTWAAEVIEKAEGYGLMNGYPDGTFGVGKELTRGEFVAVLCRMFGWDAASPGAPAFVGAGSTVNSGCRARKAPTWASSSSGAKVQVE